MLSQLTANALQILEARYLLRNSKDRLIESPEQLLKRVAKHVASTENTDTTLWEESFYQSMVQLEFLPNSPTLMNAGLPKGQLSACFVLPVEDSLEAIFTTLKNAAMIHQSGGGTGYNFSSLRPKGDLVSSTGGTSSGPIAFMEVYDSATEHVKQGGKRRGANMGILNIDHPDIEEFIVSKSEGKRLKNFNISVGITDAFMLAVEKDAQWVLRNPRTQKIERTVSAKALWDTIVREAFATGDPGLIFLDTINGENPLPKKGRILATNPCGEVPLLDYESCNLGSINLTKMLQNDGNHFQIDWNKLDKTIKISIRFLDNVISCNYYLLPEIKENTQANRKIGLGIMGWAELLILLDIPYASDKAVALAEKLMQFIQEKSYAASRSLAKERGTFQAWEDSNYAPDRPIRNATCNSIAPTGSISVIANTSYSIEPLYALSYNRVGILDNKTQNETNGIFVNRMKQLGLWTEEVKAAVTATGSIQQLKYLSKETKKLFETSLEIPWKYHLLHQKAFQKYTDNAVSKTINLSETTAIKAVSEIYKTAWEYGLKGITIYRNGSKVDQVLRSCGVDLIDACSL
ncbi:MAG: adenosylcobalamin-dependent ribonucleoside-diphosphate reductase [Maribacter sp.]|nr:adenosylcobalamin-dependent ribonucleoside-diphosphate reductase [Maribacter sp.]